MKKYIYLQMVVLGKLIKRLVTNTHTPLKLSTSKQEQLGTLEVAQKLSSLKDKSPIFVPKRRTTNKRKKLYKARGKCPVTDKINRTEANTKKKVRDNRLHGLTLRAYKCEFCPHWHLTHKKDRITFH